jgi:hypothetical protein
MSDKSNQHAAWVQKRNEKLIRSAEPQLDGDEVRALFLGQNRISPFWELVLLPLLLPLLPVILLVWLLGLIIPAVGSLLPRKRLILVTERNVCCFPMQRGRFGVKDVLQKAPLGEVGAEEGFPWSLKVDGWPTVYASEWVHGERDEVASLINRTDRRKNDLVHVDL